MSTYTPKSYEGFPKFRIPPAYLKTALILLISGSEKLKKRKFVEQLRLSQKRMKRKTLENTITRELVSEIEKEQEKYKIRADSLVENRTHPLKDIKYSQIDIRFIWNDYSKNGYLATEAKILYGTGSRLGGPYVEEGVCDFVIGKYSCGHTHGIMLGYILSSPIDKAILAVEEALDKRRKKTNEVSRFDQVKDFLTYSLIYSSIHKQCPTNTNIQLYHLFADFAS